MITPPPQVTSDWFRNATQASLLAFKTAMSFQEQSLKWWSGMMDVMNASAAWQQLARNLGTEAFSLMQKNADFYTRLMDAQRKGMELFQQTMPPTGRSGQDIEAPVQQAWEKTFAAMQSTGEAFMQANARAMKCWTDLVHDGAART
jgi:hypothetical protein